MSQRARVVTEYWIEREMYCPSCDSSSLDRLVAGRRVFDFQCPLCDELYQVKSMAFSIPARIVDSGYSAMMDAINLNLAPNLMLIHYSPVQWDVVDLVMIPRYLLVASAIEKRNPLGPRARRAGWVGCNILLDEIPPYGRVSVVQNRRTMDPRAVRKEWNRLSFIREIRPDKRGWLVDVLACVQSLGRTSFTLHDVYRFEGRLSRLHPLNKNIRPKIRQQLQILRDKGILAFLGAGTYQMEI